MITSDTLKAPVLTSVNQAQLDSFLGFMKRLHADASIVAGIESERLKPYLAAFSRQLKEDIRSAKPADKRGLGKLTTAPSLRKLFNAVAKSTGNTNSD